MSSGRFPDRFPDDVVVEDVDLDETEVIVGGQRLTEARAERLAEETLDAIGRGNEPR